jgi:queuosine precursor transporter
LGAAPVTKGNTLKRLILTLAFIAGILICILAANYVTTRYGMVPVGFGLMATAGTYLAGLTFVLRDSLQDVAGKVPTLMVIAAGAVLSFGLAAPQIALASAVAFALAELADLAVYTPLRKRGYIRAAVASNIVGALVDTVIFLWIAGFPIMAALPGQMVGKLLITAVAVIAVATIRATRKPVTA